MQYLNQCKKLGSVAINSIGFLLIGLVLAGNLFITTSVSYDWDEIVSYHITLRYLILIPLLLLFLHAYLKIAKRKEICQIFRFFSILYLIAGAYIIFNVTSCIRADAAYVWNAAGSFLDGDFTSLQREQYLGIFPYQLGMATYELFLRLFANNEKILYTANLLEILLINFLGYRITDLLFRDDVVTKLVIFLEFAFLPQFFFTMFGYGIVPGLCCLMAAFYFTLKLYQHWSRKRVFAICFFAALAGLNKANFKIGAIAIVLLLLLKSGLSGKQCMRQLLAGFLIIFSMVAASGLTTLAYQAISGIEISDGTPIQVNIAMGTDLNNQWKAPGWFDGYTTSAYADAGYDTDVASQRASEKIKNNLAGSVSDPSRAFSFYWRKMLSTWCDPLFQSVWSGPIFVDFEKEPILKSLYQGGIMEKCIACFSKAVVFIIFSMNLVFLLRHGKKYPFSMVLYLYFIGGFLFHLISETKSQYVYPYVFCLIPMAAYELKSLITSRSFS